MTPSVIDNEAFNKAIIDIDFNADEFLSCFDYGDYVAVTPEGYSTFYVPVVFDYFQVASGDDMMLVVPGNPTISLVRNTYGVHVDFRRNDEATQRWRFLEGKVHFPLKVSIELFARADKSNEGAVVPELKRKDSIKYYPDLTVEEFANFRMISVPGIKKGLLYRSSSPIDPSIGRYTYVDSLAREAEISAFINLTDDSYTATRYEGFRESYYAKQSALFAWLPTKYTLLEFKQHMVSLLRYIYTVDGPILIHCKEGKDRTGFVSAVLEALVGTPLDDIMADYLKSFTNFYNVEGKKHVGLDADELKRLKNAFINHWIAVYADVGVDIADIEKVDLAEATARYLENIGFDQDDMSMLMEKLLP